jgi:tetratricopeptide (TPR) repeat protein
MSDSEEYEYEYDSDEQYQSEEEDQMKAAASCVSDEESSKAERNALRDARIELENTFYEAEDFKQRGQFETAKTFFEKVISLEQKENIKWSFQAYENIVKICASTKKWEEMIQNYQQMLTFLENVTRNESTDSISSILDTVSSSCSDTKDKQSSIYTSKVT